MTLVLYDVAWGSAPPSVEALRIWAGWQRALKRHRKHVARCGADTKIVDAEIRVLQTCVTQLLILNAAQRSSQSRATPATEASHRT